MKRLLTAMAIAAAAIHPALSAGPVARPEATVVEGNARFTVLTPEMIRIEYSPSGKFEDNATFTVINRDLPVPEFSRRDDGNYLVLSTGKLKLRYRKGSNPLTVPASDRNLTVIMDLNGEETIWFPGKKDPMNLRGTYRTLDQNSGDAYRSKMEQGVISRSGWAVIDDSPAATRADGSRSLALLPGGDDIDWVAPRADKDALDLYFMGYGHDYKKALGDFTKIAGSIPMPPDYVLGYWYSKYDSYTADDFRNIVGALKANDINSDVLILDMDWHWNGDSIDSAGRGGWTGWSWNTHLIPDPAGLLNDIHDAGLRVALNLHPADGVDSSEDMFGEMCADLGLSPGSTSRIPWQLEKKDFTKSFFKRVIHPMEKMGVDFWWLDWQQKLVNDSVDGLGQTMWCNHVFFSEMAKNRTGRRPVIFHRWGGLGSHRYQIGFSGDAYINYPTLAFEPYFTATASNVCYAYWGHDLGGHMINFHEANDPELLLRWMQFGVFTPIFRTHATKDPRIERRIWTYDNFPQLNATVKLRYSLFPYIYAMARKAYETGIGICRPMYYDYPELDEAYTCEGQYFFGDDIIVAPVTEPSENGLSSKKVWLPEGNWWAVDLGRLVEGGGLRTLDFGLDQIPYFYREGAIVVRNPEQVKSVSERPGHLLVDIVAGRDGASSYYEDGGDNSDYAKVFAKTPISLKHGKNGSYSVTISPREGSYPSMPDGRSYSLRVYNTSAPKSVRLNGKTLAAHYDPENRCTTLELPASPCNAVQKIDIAQ